MRYLVSSKYLASKLHGFDFFNDAVTDTKIDGNVLTLVTQTSEIHIKLTPSGGYMWKDNPKGARWDWVKRLVDTVDDQPIILVFGEDQVNITFQY